MVPGVPAGAGTALKSKRAINGIEAAIDSGAIWRRNPLKRGQQIEDFLSGTRYADWGRVGNQARGKFPLIDFHNSNLNAVCSLKTFVSDVSAPRFFLDSRKDFSWPRSTRIHEAKSR